MSERITSDHPIGAHRRPLLDALLDTLLPASADGRMPSAAQLDLLAHFERHEGDYLPQLAQLLDAFDAGFAHASADERRAQVAALERASPAAFQALLLRVYDAYYQQDAVREGIGVRAGAPFPAGNTLHAGNLSLLDPVIRDAARHRYRNA